MVWRQCAHAITVVVAVFLVTGSDAHRPRRQFAETTTDDGLQNITEDFDDDRVAESRRPAQQAALGELVPESDENEVPAAAISPKESSPVVHYLRLAPASAMRLVQVSSGFIHTHAFASGVRMLASSNGSSSNSSNSINRGPKPEKISLQTAFATSAGAWAFSVAVLVLVAFVYWNPEKVPLGELNEAATEEFKDWEHGLCDCCGDSETCLCGLCCPAVRWAITIGLVPGLLAFWAALAFFIGAHAPSELIMGAEGEIAKNTFDIAVWKLAASGCTAANFGQHDKCTVPIATFVQGDSTAMFSFAAVLLCSVAGAFYRQQIRVTFGMPNGGATVCTDFLFWWLCPCCSIIQEARHVETARRAGHKAFVRP